MNERSPNGRAAKRVSLREVGERAGVSFQTVGKVLRGKGSVAPATRVRVLEAAEELGYVPNSLARGLASNETRSIGFVASGLASFVLAPLLLGAEREARKHGYFVLFNFIDEQTGDGVRTLNQLIERRADGVVSAAPTLQHDAGYGALLRNAVPSVTSHPIMGGGVPHVGQHPEEPGFLGARHLTEYGHRHIATITGDWSGVGFSGRLAGYARALGEVGVNVDRELIDVGHWSVEGGYQAMRRLLELGREFSAVVTHNDHMAMGAMRALSERGLHIPDDISVVGCDDVDFARFTNPPLTTVQMSFESSGVAAVRLLVDRLQGQEATPERIVLPCSLVVRESTRPISVNN